MLILGSRTGRVSLSDLAEAAAAGGVDAVQVRMPGAAPERVREVVAVVRERIGERAMLLVNGAAATAAPIAAALGGGVHLPERAGAEAIAAARTALGPGALIGRSVHAPEAAAASAGADYLLAGHVFPTPSHPGAPPLGLAGLARIRAAAPCPVLAVGGIDPGNVAAVVRAGAAGVAVIGAIVAAENPERAARALREALAAALEERMDTQTQTTAPIGTEARCLDVTVNGKPVEVAAGWTVHDFLASKRLSQGMALVELNGTILARAAYGETPLRQGDTLEVVHAVGGG
jgi:thiamine biosynthesis protein ThiS